MKIENVHVVEVRKQIFPRNQIFSQKFAQKQVISEHTKFAPISKILMSSIYL
jgi:hypothetical protein